MNDKLIKVFTLVIIPLIIFTIFFIFGKNQYSLYYQNFSLHKNMTGVFTLYKYLLFGLYFALISLFFGFIYHLRLKPVKKKLYISILIILMLFGYITFCFLSKFFNI